MIEVFNETKDNLKRREALIDFIKMIRNKSNYDKEIRKRETNK